MKDIEIIFENDDVVVINKPGGLMVHNDGHNDEATVAQWLVAHTPEAQGVGEAQENAKGIQLERSGIVHRLDKDTSGVMILAKTQEAFEHLKAQFHDRIAKKEYRAFTYGTMREKWGTIDRPIGRSSRDFRLRSAQRGAKGTIRDAITDWECLKTGLYKGEVFSYLQLMPRTGRTHQLRVHLKAVDRGIVSDPLYGGKRVEQSNNLDFTELALHAHSLTLVLPDGTEQQFVAEVPESFVEAEAKIEE